MFVFLSRTERKSFDPRHAVSALVSFSHGRLSKGHQHDVAEIMQLIIDAIDVAFEAKEHKNEEFKKWFYGNCREMITLNASGEEKKISDRDIVYGDVILEVDATELHAALERYTNCSIEKYRLEDGETVAARKSLWFKTFPEILCFQIQRTRYDKTKRIPTKIHSRFTFPKRLFVDRYCLSKKDEASPLREEHRKKLERIEMLRKKQQSIEKFGDGVNEIGPIPLDKAVRATLEYLKERHMKALLRSNQETKQETNKETKSDEKKVNQESKSDDKKDDLASVITSLNNELQEIKGRMKDLQTKVSEVNAKIKGLYTPIESTAYRLKAIMVHEGKHASQGHYWAFVDGHNESTEEKIATTDQKIVVEPEDGKIRSKWIKFNDATVNEEKEQVVFNESYGGHLNASAYCLVYTLGNSSNDDLDEGEIRTIFDQEVKDDNRKLQEYRP